MLEFGQYISFVVLVIVGMITDLHLSGKPMLRPVQATWPKYPERCFYSVTLSQKVDLERWHLDRIFNFVALMITEKISDYIYMGNSSYDLSRLHGPSTRSVFFFSVTR